LLHSAKVLLSTGHLTSILSRMHNELTKFSLGVPLHESMTYPFSLVFSRVRFRTPHTVLSRLHNLRLLQTQTSRITSQSTILQITQNAWIYCALSTIALENPLTCLGHPEAFLHRRRCQSVRSIHSLINSSNTSRAKKHATDQGGKIGHEYTIFKGFSYVDLNLGVPL